jgi:hypothetical protein
MTPGSGHPGTVITIQGDNFGDTQGSKLIAINLERVNLMAVRRWSNTEIEAVVPNLPVGEYTVVIYYDNTYRTSAPWTSAHRFRIIPREVPPHEPRPNPSDIHPPLPPRSSCTPLAKAVNMLCNSDFDTVGPLGATTSRSVSTGGGAGDSAAKFWWLFVNGSGILKTSLEDSDRSSGTFRPRGKMIHVITNNWATGILQQFLARDSGPQRVTFAVWVKVVKGTVEVSLGNWGNQLRGGWRVAAKSRMTGQWELLSGCSLYKPNEPLPLNQLFIASSSDTTAEFYVDFAEVKNADPSWTGGGCVELSH